MFLNAVSFQIILGAPIILYAKSIGAGSTVIGILASFTPLMTVLQWPAAKYLHVYGYKRFVLAGWGFRSIFIFVVAAVPLMGFLDATSKLVLITAALFIFNVLRGIASAAWMPWIAALVPDGARAGFLSRDQIAMFIGSLLALALSSVLMTGRVDAHEYSLVFVVSAVAGVASLVFIKKIPDVAAEEVLESSSRPVPWREIIAHPPFFQLMMFNLVFVLVVGSLGVFTVEYLHESPGFNVSQVLYLTGISFLGSLFALTGVGRLTDRFGAKPLIAASLVLLGLVIGGWFLVAAGAVPCSRRVIAGLNFAAGMAGAAFNVANGRLAMATIPVMGRNHFFALFTVVTSLGLGAAPVVWGISLDFLGTFEAVTGAFHWRRHSIYFAVLFAMNLVAIWKVGRLHEEPAAQGMPGNQPA